jgi:hypothetical protein
VRLGRIGFEAEPSFLLSRPCPKNLFSAPPSSSVLVYYLRLGIPSFQQDRLV